MAIFNSLLYVYQWVSHFSGHHLVQSNLATEHLHHLRGNRCSNIILNHVTNVAPKTTFQQAANPYSLSGIMVGLQTP